MLQINVAELRRRPGESAYFNLSSEFPPLEYLGEKNVFTGPVMVRVAVFNGDGLFQVEGNITGNLQFNCNRCQEPFDYSFTAPLVETYYPAVQGRAGAGEEAVPFSGDVIDLAPEAQKSILINLPMKVVCRQECLGLCRQCGVNLNENVCQCADMKDSYSHMAGLKDLFKNNGGQ
ncbi:MAG: DUF177 domain-containing protein [Peptococcaceae bacterium]|nr:MAG: DUF177 domain-containing protein [Peptococcaceae bacterium]